MTTNHGLLGVSIDLNDAEARRTVGLKVVREVLQLFETHKIPATWSLAEPATSAWAREIEMSAGCHEVAIAGDASWVGAAAGRTRFAQELSRRVTAARESGYKISTLVLHGTDLTDHLDLMVKQRISVIRGNSSHVHIPGLHFQPQSSRFGIWRTPEPAVFPGKARWWRGGNHLQIRRLLQNAIRFNATAHVAIDGTAKLESSLKSLEKLLTYLRRLSDEGTLTVEPLGKLALRWTRSASVPSKSILRAA